MHTSEIFLYGTLRHAPLLAIVLGDVPMPELEPASLSGHEVLWARDAGYPVLCAGEGRVEGLLARNVSEEARARLDYYELGFGYELIEVEVEIQGTPAPHGALVYAPTEPPETGTPWTLADWVARWWPITQYSAREVMGSFGMLDAGQVARRYPMILGRAASRLRAEADPTPLPPGPAPMEPRLDIASQRTPYANYFSLEEYDVSFRRFDGTMGPRVNRAAFIGSDAAIVLPYDAARDRVLIVEQFRTGPLARGDSQPWSLEPIAGRIDAGESPEQAARREAREETGLVLGRLFEVAAYYPSPGAVSEYFYSFVGLADLHDTAQGLGGLSEEAEDIRSHVLGFDEFMEMASRGALRCGPLVLTALWLQANRSRLRALA